MKYMLMMNAPRGTRRLGCDEVAGRRPAGPHQIHEELHEGLADAGELVGGRGSGAPVASQGRARAGDGTPAVTDGPFAEAKEFLAGYWIVDVDHPARAYEIAAGASAAPGPGGKPMNMPIEVREVMSAPPVEV